MTRAARERSLVRTPVLLVSAVAWILMAVLPEGAAPCCAPHASSLATMLARYPLSSMASSWALMLIAMMLPLMVAPVRHVRDRSFARRRWRATALFIAGYLLVWMLGGVGLWPVALTIRNLADGSTLPVIGAACVVATWQTSPPRQACLNRLHAHPHLSAFGLAADVDPLRFGLAHGAWCLGSCWALMLLPMLLGRGHIAAMVAVSLWVWGEQLEGATAPRWSLRIPTRAMRMVLAQAQMRGTGQSASR